MAKRIQPNQIYSPSQSQQHISVPSLKPSSPTLFDLFDDDDVDIQEIKNETTAPNNNNNNVEKSVRSQVCETEPMEVDPPSPQKVNTPPPKTSSQKTNSSKPISKTTTTSIRDDNNNHHDESGPTGIIFQPLHYYLDTDAVQYKKHKKHQISIGYGDDETIENDPLTLRRMKEATLYIRGRTPDGKDILIEIVGIKTKVKVLLPPAVRHLHPYPSHLPVTDELKEERAQIALGPWQDCADQVFASIFAAGKIEYDEQELFTTRLCHGTMFFGNHGAEQEAYAEFTTTRHDLARRLRTNLEVCAVHLPLLPTSYLLHLIDPDYNPVVRTMAEHVKTTTKWLQLPAAIETVNGYAVQRDSKADVHFRVGVERLADTLIKVDDQDLKRWNIPLVADMVQMSVDIEMWIPDVFDVTLPDTVISSIAASVRINQTTYENRVFLYIPRDRAIPKKVVDKLDRWKKHPKQRPKWFTELLKEHNDILPTRENAPMPDTRVVCDLGGFAQVIICYSERDMINEYIKFESEICPDVISGFRVTYFDVEAIAAHAERYELLDDFCSTGILPWFKAQRKQIDKQSNAKMFANKTIIDHPFCVYMDTYDQAQDRQSEFSRCDLNTVSMITLKKGKIEVNFDMMYFCWWHCHMDTQDKYVMRDATLPLELMQQWQTMNVYRKSAEETYGTIKMIVENMLQARLYNTITVECERQNKLFVKRDLEAFCSLDIGDMQSAEAHEKYNIVPLQTLVEQKRELEKVLGAQTCHRIPAAAASTATSLSSKTTNTLSSSSSSAAAAGVNASSKNGRTATATTSNDHERVSTEKAPPPPQPPPPPAPATAAMHYPLPHEKQKLEQLQVQQQPQKAASGADEAVLPQTATFTTTANAKLSNAEQRRARLAVLNKIARDHRGAPKEEIAQKQTLYNLYDLPPWEIRRLAQVTKDNPRCKGGAVQTPVRRLCVMSGFFDVKAMYPSIIILYNLSPENLIVEHKFNNLPGNLKYESFVIENQPENEYIPRKYIILQDPSAIYPTILRRWGSQRDELRAQLKVAEAEYEEIKKQYNDDENHPEVINAYNRKRCYDSWQLAVKQLCNALYGFAAAGKRTGKCPCNPLATIITHVGRTFIHKCKDAFIKEGNEIEYGDSVTGDTALIIRHKGVIQTARIDELVEDDAIWQPLGNEKEMVVVPELEVWQETGFTKVNKIIRHVCHKPIMRVSTHTGVVDCTTDHSLVRSDGSEARPTDVKVGDALLHVSSTEIAALFETINAKKQKEEEATQMITSSKEAFAMGLFVANGTCDSFECLSQKQYSWAIHHTDLSLLHKTRDCLSFETTILDDTCHSSGVYKLVPVNDHVDHGEYAPIRSEIGSSVITTRYRRLFYNRHKQKRIPPEILNANINVVQQFWNGFHAGNKNNSTTSQTLSSTKCKIDQKGKEPVTGLWMLAHRLGYKTIFMNDHSEKHDDVFRMTCNDFDPTTYVQDPEQIQTLRLLSDSYTDYVYDLETSSHHFHVGPGALVVHNTDSLMIANPEVKRMLTENKFTMEEIYELVEEAKARFLAETGQQMPPEKVALYKINLARQLKYTRQQVFDYARTYYLAKAAELSKLSGLELGVEKVAELTIFVGRKQYIMMKIDPKDFDNPLQSLEELRKSGKIVCRGVRGGVRKDVSPFTSSTLKEFYPECLFSRDIRDLLIFVINKAVDIWMDRVSLDDAAITQTIKKYMPYMVQNSDRTISSDKFYSLENLPIVPYLAQKEYRLDPSHPIMPGDKVSYVIGIPDFRIPAAQRKRREQAVELNRAKEMARDPNVKFVAYKPDILRGAKCEIVHLLMSVGNTCRLRKEQQTRMQDDLNEKPRIGSTDTMSRTEKEWERLYDNMLDTLGRAHQCDMRDHIHVQIVEYERVRNQYIDTCMLFSGLRKRLDPALDADLFEPCEKNHMHVLTTDERIQLESQFQLLLKQETHMLQKVFRLDVPIVKTASEREQIAKMAARQEEDRINDIRMENEKKERAIAVYGALMETPPTLVPLANNNNNNNNTYGTYATICSSSGEHNSLQTAQGQAQAQPLTFSACLAVSRTSLSTSTSSTSTSSRSSSSSSSSASVVTNHNNNKNTVKRGKLTPAMRARQALLRQPSKEETREDEYM